MLVKLTKKTQDVAKKQAYSSLGAKSFKKFKHFLGKYKALRTKRLTSLIRRAVPVLDSNKENTPEFKIPESKVKENYKVTKLSKSDVELDVLLGAGGFGSVYRATYKKKTVAVKVMHKLSKNPEAHLESFKAEQLVLKFNHPNIVRTIATTSLELFNEGAYIVMELAGKMTLQALINNDNEQLYPETRLRISYQIASALKYAHDRSVVHLDLKPANILITGDGNCKVCDFGCSQKVQQDKGVVSPTQRSALTGTFAYRAPELLRGDAPSKAADIYSFGITLWEMLARETPYGNENQHVVIFGVVAYGQRPKHPEIDSDPFEECYRDLYSQCWSATSTDRPSASELVELLKIWKNFM